MPVFDSACHALTTLAAGGDMSGYSQEEQDATQLVLDAAHTFVFPRGGD